MTVRSILMTMMMVCGAAACVAQDDVDVLAEELAEDTVSDSADDPTEPPLVDELEPAASLLRPPPGTPCFSCVLDPSIRVCSTHPNALYLCERECIVCDQFGDNQGECFRGPCILD